MMTAARIAACMSGRRTRGMTLVELMVGMALGLLMAAALMRLFADASANGQNIQRASTQIEDGRYAGELLRDDMQLAGYYAQVPMSASTTTSPNPCTVAATDFVASPLAFPPAVRGYRAADALACLSNRRNDTDALVVRRLEVVTTTAGALAGGNAQFYLQYSFCSTDPSTTPLVFGQASSDFVLRTRDCASVSPLRAFVSRTYFVASCNDCSGSGDGIPTLKRMDLVGNTRVETALVEGVETLRFEYGFDTDGDGAPDTFLTTAAATGAASLWENVTAVRLHYIVRSLDKVNTTGMAGAQTFSLGGAGTVTAADDGYVRRSYSTTVRLVNVSGPREQQ